MKVEYNKWCKCEKGTMPEDFENIHLTKGFLHESSEDSILLCVVTETGSTMRSMDLCKTEGGVNGFTSIHNDYYNNWDKVLAWMLPEPYKE